MIGEKGITIAETTEVIKEDKKDSMTMIEREVIVSTTTITRKKN